jgi:hypothetical protein
MESLYSLASHRGYQAVDNSLRHKVTTALKAVFPGSDHDVSLDQNGIVGLSFEGDDSLTLEVPEFGEVFHVYVPVMHVPLSDRLAALERTLALNLFSITVPAAWLALDSGEDRLLLCMTLSSEICDGGKLAGLFEDLLTEAERLRPLASGASDISGAETGEPQDLSLINIRI